MAKGSKTVFVCSECGYESAKWMGQCICGAWNSFYEEKAIDTKKNDKRGRSSVMASGKSERRRPMPLCEITSGDYSRFDTGIGELNRVLGGGIVKGSLTLISGEPGIGKSTIIVQAAARIAEKYGKVLYISGEESEEQIKMRADRVCSGIKTDNLFILSETDMENIENSIEEFNPVFLIIDSIQTMYTPDLDSAPGSVSQVRDCGNQLMRIGKVRNIPIFLVAHVTKSGELAGPKIIEHLVDCVLSFTGERSHELRILRAHKNRFGTTSEIGAFEMAQEGLAEIENLSGSLLSQGQEDAEGSAATAVYEGTRPMLMEIQGLTAPANVGFARRTSIGVDNTRVSMIIAVLERKAGISMINQDVYVNVVGGMRPEGTSTDLAVALALYSSYKGITISKNVLAVGEIGLTGEIRPIQNAEKIIKEASRMGFQKVILPKRSAEKIVKKPQGIKLCPVADIKAALDEISGRNAPPEF